MRKAARTDRFRLDLPYFYPENGNLHYPPRMSLIRLVLPLALCSCATAADGDVRPDANPDARVGVTFPDAGPQVDAGPKPDANQTPTIDATVPSIDADLSSGLCDDNSECTVNGECCFIFCVPGTEIGDSCFPD